MSTQVLHQKPQFGKLFGITHDVVTKAPLIKVPKVLKVGIGISKGRAIQVFLFNNEWHIRHGAWEKTGGKDKFVMKTVYRGGQTINGVLMANTREAAEAWHNANKGKAEVSNRPQKIPYFTFTRRVLTEDGGRLSESFEPDFDAIEAHGNWPVRVPIIISTENPLFQEYAWYTASELKCHGDGLLAERQVSIGSTKDQFWQQAHKAGERMFLYEPCYKTGCPHAKVDCTPHSTLSFQLAHSLRIGATAYFSSPGQVSADRLFSSLDSIRELIERRGYSISGIPMDLVLGSFAAKADGKASMQPCVSLELRAAGNRALRQIMDENSWTPMQLSAPVPQQITAGDEEGVYDAIPEAGGAFDADTVDADFEEEEAPLVIPAAAATQSKQDAIARKLAERQAVVVTPEPPVPGTLAEPPAVTEPETEELF